MAPHARHFLVSSLLAAGVLLAACSGEKQVDELVSSARNYMAKGDNAAAVIQLKGALQQRPDWPEARFLLGKALLDKGDPVSASLELRKASELGYAATEIAPVLARSLLAERQFQKVIDQFENVVLTDLTWKADLKTSLATAYAALGNAERARALIGEALAAATDFPATLMLQARMAADERRFDQALVLVEKVIAARPDDVEAWQAKAALFLSGKRDADGAMAAYRKVLAIRPGHPEAQAGLISVLLGKYDLKAGAEQIEVLRKVAPDHPQTAYFDALLAFLRNEPTRARDLIRQVIKVAPDSPEALQLAGTIEYRNGSLLEAERSLSKALLLAPNMPVARRQLAQTFLRMGQPAKALSTLEPLLAQTDVDARTHALAGEAHLMAGELALAESSFSKAAKLDPGNATSRTALAMSKLKAAGIDATALELREIAAADKGTQADMALISLHLRNKDYTKALAAVDALETKQPNKASTAELRGRVLLLRKDTAEARKSFERALKLDPLDFSTAARLAGLDVAEGKSEAARKRFEALLAADPKNVHALTAVAQMRIREGAPRDEIARLLTNAAALNPSEPMPRLVLVNYYLELRDIKAALTAAQDSVSALPDNADLVDVLGQAQMAADEHNQAISSFKKLATLEPQSSRAYVRLAGVQVAVRDVGAAESSLRKALEISPNLLAAQKALFDIAVSNRRHQDAVLIARTVQKQIPTGSVGFMMEAAAEAARNNLAAAADLYASTLKKFPQTEPAVRLHSVLVAARRTAEADQLSTKWLSDHPKDLGFLTYLADAALARRSYAAAEKHYRKVIEIQPNHAGGLNNLAWVLARQGRPDALAFAERADKLHPNSPGVLDTLAIALAANKQLPRALKVQRQAVALSPSDAGLRLTLAKLLLQAGDKAAARAELEPLAKLGSRFPGNAEVAELLKTL